MRILLMCRPVILNRILADILSGNPEFHLVESSTEPVDVVITTGINPSNVFDDTDVAPTRAKVIISVDRQRNTIYVRRRAEGHVGIEMLPGEMPVLLDLLDREVTRQHLRLIDGRTA